MQFIIHSFRSQFLTHWTQRAFQKKRAKVRFMPPGSAVYGPPRYAAYPGVLSAGRNPKDSDLGRNPMSEKPIHLQKNTQQIVSKMSNTINQSLNIYQCAQTGGIRTCAALFGQIWRVCCFRAPFVVENVAWASEAMVTVRTAAARAACAAGRNIICCARVTVKL